MIKEFNHPEKPFEVNDRVKHKLFGEGFVEKLKLATNYQHYYVHVVFDEEYQVRETAASTRYRYLVSNYLEKIAGTQPTSIPVLDALDPID
jgi:hypothetical protein